MVQARPPTRSSPRVEARRASKGVSQKRDEDHYHPLLYPIPPPQTKSAGDSGPQSSRLSLSTHQSSSSLDKELIGGPGGNFNFSVKGAHLRAHPIIQRFNFLLLKEKYVRRDHERGEERDVDHKRDPQMEEGPEDEHRKPEARVPHAHGEIDLPDERRIVGDNHDERERSHPREVEARDLRVGHHVPDRLDLPPSHS